MAFDPFSKMKRKEITAARELLRIQALGWNMPFVLTLLLYSLVTFLYAIFMTGVFKGPDGADNVFLIISSIFGTAIYAGAIVSIKLVSKSKRQPLIFTERGIAGPYFIAIKWEDIEGYTWEDFRGYTAMAGAPKGGGTSLYIRDKGILPHYIDRFGHTVLVNYGYFFDQEQIQQTEGILQKFGVIKLQ